MILSPLTFSDFIILANLWIDDFTRFLCSSFNFKTEEQFEIFSASSACLYSPGFICPFLKTYFLLRRFELIKQLMQLAQSKRKKELMHSFDLKRKAHELFLKQSVFS